MTIEDILQMVGATDIDTTTVKNSQPNLDFPDADEGYVTDFRLPGGEDDPIKSSILHNGGRVSIACLRFPALEDEMVGPDVRQEYLTRLQQALASADVGWNTHGGIPETQHTRPHVYGGSDAGNVREERFSKWLNNVTIEVFNEFSPEYER